jgi:hypothetical protein
LLKIKSMILKRVLTPAFLLLVAICFFGVFMAGYFE